MKISKIIAAALLVLLAGCAPLQQARNGGDAAGAVTSKQWFSAWATSHNMRASAPAMSGRTVRMVLVPTVSGDAVRVKLENTMGQAPVVFSGAFIGFAGVDAAVKERSNTRLTFDGKPGLTLAAGQGAYSDPVPFTVGAFEKLSLSLDVQSAPDISVHQVGLRTNWSAAGARAADISGAGFEPLPEVSNPGAGNWPFYWVAALDVRSAQASGTIVLFGDSITDGRCSTRDDKRVVQPNLYQRWGDVLAARLAAQGQQFAIVNAGISGNQLIGRGNGPPGLDRFERDVLDRAGVTHVVLFEGTNDIKDGEFTAAQIIAGMEQVRTRLRAKGIKIIGVTVIPRGHAAPALNWNSKWERERVSLNEWMRTKAGFDGLIDFDALMKNGLVVTMADGGTAPTIPPSWNCDGVHPNAAGYKAMGEYVDLKLFVNSR